MGGSWKGLFGEVSVGGISNRTASCFVTISLRHNVVRTRVNPYHLFSQASHKSLEMSTIEVSEQVEESPAEAAL